LKQSKIGTKELKQTTLIDERIKQLDGVQLEEVLHWVMWERDCFAEQIREIGGEPFLKWECTDTVHVVRCKDCKYYAIYELKRDGTDDMRHKPSVCIKEKYAVHRKPDWYCADGERKEDE